MRVFAPGYIVNENRTFCAPRHVCWLTPIWERTPARKRDFAPVGADSEGGRISSRAFFRAVRQPLEHDVDGDVG